MPPGKEHAAINVLKAHGVPLPSNGIKYNLEEAVENIMQFPKWWKERGIVIEAMVSKSCVLSKTISYDIIQNKERRMNKSSITGLGYQGSYVRFDIQRNVSWKGSIVLSLIPVRFTGTIGYWGGSLSPRRIQYPQTIDPCLLIGNTDLAKISTDLFKMRNSKGK